MTPLDSLIDFLQPALPSGLTIVAVVAVLWATHFFLEKRVEAVAGTRARNQLIMLALTAVGLLVILLVLPISETTRGQLLGLLGILLSAAIALSSTTFVGNAMAGLMLRATRSFRSGDFLQVGEHFGRVSERGLFHLELQTEDRDLTTLPNLYLVTQAVRVVRSSGTIVSATVSLGYDVARTRIEKLLTAAALGAGLEEPFVQIRELGDFAVTYRVAGLLEEVKQLISVRAELRARMLDELHRGGIEIVSPNFMNTRAVADGKSFIPPLESTPAPDVSEAAPVESLIFDKADEAESLEQADEARQQLEQQLQTIGDNLRTTNDESERRRLEGERQRLTEERERLKEVLASATEESRERG